MHDTKARTILALALVATSVAALGSFAGPVAPASAITSSHKTDYLHFPPWRPHFRDCLEPRSLRLNGTYAWRVYDAHWNHRDQPFWHRRELRLRGRHTWFVCRQHVVTGYRFESVLHREEPGNGQVSLDKYEYGGVYGDGNYDWGSTLKRIGPYRR